MSGVEKGGLSGEGAKAEWLPPVLTARHDEAMKDLPPLPKGMKLPMMPAYHPPWTSLGQAPTAEQLDENDYSGVA